MKTYYPRKGFTLVEIMIVVVIIGLLAAMALPAFSLVRLRARQKSVLTNLRQISSAAQTYMTSSGLTQVNYTELVGSDTEDYIHAIVPVANEDYTTLTMVESQTQMTISSVSFGTITFSN